MRQPHEYKDTHTAADAFEPRLSRAYVRAVERMRSGISINALAAALAMKDQKTAMQILQAGKIEDALTPMVAIRTDAFMKGGRIAAGQIRKMVR